jgi:hypothetical protein
MSRWLEPVDSADLWKLLCDDGGLRPQDYDDSLALELAQALHLDSSLDIETELRRADLPVERFVTAFFEAAAPFVAMWSDLLAMFERAGAKSSSENLRVEYDFSAKQPPLKFDLDSFRQVLAIAQQVMSPVWFGSESASSDLWQLSDAIGDLAGGRLGPSDSTGDPQVDTFAQACRAGLWPAALPPRPPADPIVGALLDELWVVADTFLRGLRAVSSDHVDLMARPPGDAIVIAGLAERDLRQIESDYWLPTLIATAVAATRSANATDQDAIIERIGDALTRLCNTDPTRTSPGRRLQDFLALPLWQHRYEVFSNWVCARLLDALNDQEPRLHTANGAIEFRFSGTHLATFESFDPRLHLWTELRSPLDNPVGAGRTSHIQPDMCLLLDPITARVTPIAVECKQYRRASNKKFAHALTDYLRGLPDADVILVDYGPARRDAVLKLVPAELADRARVIGEFRPDRPVALATFRAVVRSRFDLPNHVSTTQGTIALTWSSPPDDLDLHVTVPCGAGPIEVSYNDLGAVDEEPYCTLDRDITVGGTPEQITVHRWLPGIYEIHVNQYTDDGEVQPGNAAVFIETPLMSKTFACPSLKHGQTWHVCNIDGTSGAITEIR